MARRSRIKLVGKRASFETERWAQAVEALAHQLQRQRPHETEGEAVEDTPDAPEDGRPC